MTDLAQCRNTSCMELQSNSHIFSLRFFICTILVSSVLSSFLSPCSSPSHSLFLSRRFSFFHSLPEILIATSQAISMFQTPAVPVHFPTYVSHPVYRNLLGFPRSCTNKMRKSVCSSFPLITTAHMINPNSPFLWLSV